MKMFTKLALISSMAISANAMAMQSMDDAALGATTGQDGINIGLGISAVTIEKVLIHDNDGLLAAGAAGDMGFGGTSTAGAIVIKANGSGTTATNGIVITANTAALLPSHNLADIVIDTDAGSSTGNTAFLNVAAKVSGLNIAIGEIGVSESSA
ncbi:MAG TPA: pilus assembly protein FilA, partial [Acinetobacter sp.]|nr:pilus assembly protein FilA [Acinetobacter sp.]